MSEEALPAWCAVFAELPDPRIDRTKAHSLLDILTIAVCAVLSGADSFTEMADYGRAKEGWLRTFLALPNGIPSHDTFGRVFALLDPVQLEQCFARWAQQGLGVGDTPHIACDGKTLRRTHDRGKGKSALHLISAWATESGISLGQRAVADHENEMVALPALLESVVVPGAVVTIDAIGCQRQVAQTIRQRGGDYVLALKGNQPGLYEAVDYLFTDSARSGFAVERLQTDTTLDKGHGRLERRQCWAIADPALVRYLDPEGRWPGLQSVVLVTTQRTFGTTVQRERRYYLSSLPAQAKRLNTLVRNHWRIENHLHWVLDVAFDEDQCRVRTGNADHNLALLRRLALSLLRRDRTSRAGVKGKRLQAAWDHDYLLHILTQ
jgi:predicted transposase YbfD/YdcC